MQIATTVRAAGQPWSMEEAAQYLGVSFTFIWRCVKDKKIRSFKLGRLVKLPDAEVQRIALHGFYSQPDESNGVAVTG